MTVPTVDLALLRRINETAAFNQWAGFQVTQAEPGRVELRLPWRVELGQYAGFLHAGIVTALIDTVCGFAAATVTGGVLTSHCAVSFLAPARTSEDHEHTWCRKGLLACGNAAGRDEGRVTT
jgi:acyl-coenzyme A thioesterase PaaI-like protein